MIVHADQVSREEFLSGVGGKLNGPLPPSERDFEVFERVVVEGATTRAAAAEFGLSQTRIVQVRDRVAEWIAAEVPATERLTPRQRLRLAATIASQRIDYLYSLALEAWRASKGEQTVVRDGESGLTRVTRVSHGDPKYLAMASRLSLRQLDVAEREARSQKTADRSQETGDRREETAATEIHDGDAADPPVRACSASADAPPVEPPAIISGDDASHCSAGLSDEIESRRRAFLAALAEEAAPVQRPEVIAKKAPNDQPGARDWRAAGKSRPMAQPGEGPASAGMEDHREADTSRSPARSLRKERRARRRLLERKLRAK